MYEKVLQLLIFNNVTTIYSSSKVEINQHVILYRTMRSRYISASSTSFVFVFLSMNDLCSLCWNKGHMDPPRVKDTIVVRGFKASTCDDTLLSFFENRRSGGGEIKENSIDRNSNTCTVTFVHPGG